MIFIISIIYNYNQIFFFFFNPEEDVGSVFCINDTLVAKCNSIVI